MFIAHHLDGKFGFSWRFWRIKQPPQKKQQQSHLVGKETTHQENAILATRKSYHQVAAKIFINHKPSGKPAIQLPIKTVLLSYVFQVCFKIFKFQLCSM